MAARPTDTAAGKPRVVVSMDEATRRLARKPQWRDDPAPELARNGIKPNRKGQPPNWKRGANGLPIDPPCPVQCLGVEGELKHLIDSSGQFRSWTKSDFNQAGISDLFAQQPNYPKFCWPRHGRKTKVINPETREEEDFWPIESFAADNVRDALFFACSYAGLFSPSDKLRGRGAWTTKGGQMIYHAGEELWQYDHARDRPVSIETGPHEGFLYARFPSLPAPWIEKITLADHPARELLAMLRSPNWTRPDVDPILLLGWIGVAYLGGALDWRSAVLLLGDRSTGKSTLQNDLKLIFGEALFHSSDTTAAGIYQRMKNDTRPIALDELEPGADGRKVDNVVQLMRDASSGAIGRRGSSDGVAGEFQMRSAFLFSAINNPLHQAQDLSRVATLRLSKLKPDMPPRPAINADTCGRMILAILMREWPNFPGRLEGYREALAKGGHDRRGQDTYGTLLAAADLILGAELAAELDVKLLEEPEWWSEHLSIDILPEIEDAKPNWRDCLEWLLTVRVDAWRGGKQVSIGGCLARLEKAYEGKLTGDDYTLDQARADLAAAGLGVLTAGEVAPHVQTSGWILCVPNAHPEVARLFDGQRWGNGAWKDALRQCPVDGVMLSHERINRVTIGGVQMRCTLVAMEKYQKAAER